MQNSFFITLLILFLFGCTSSKREENKLESANPVLSEVDSLMIKKDFPFYHGVASGDPLNNSVIIWTRVTPKNHGQVKVNYQISTDSTMNVIVDSGIFETDSSRDYTVKVDIKNLLPGTTYYYQFRAFDKKSPIGRTKTIAENPTQVRLGFASCSNYAWGYFNAYRIMAEDTLDAVIHLGDYIYEHEQGVYEDSVLTRNHIPNKEIVTLKDYRTRYSQYRLDEDLKAVHAAHPFITIWDDHEITNNAYETGAQNHQSETEGNWKNRLSRAKKAYYEWMPIRENEGKHYRSFSFGKLANLIMLDTRVEGRTQQPKEVDSNKSDSTMHIMSDSQMKWLKKEIEKNHQWKIIGNQILFSDMFVFWSKSPILYNDGWSAYREDQKKVKDLLNSIEGAIIVTGDFHSSFAINKTVNKINPERNRFEEFVVPSITSANYDEDMSRDSALVYQKWYESKNDLSFCNLTDHGYFILKINEAGYNYEYKFVKTVSKPSKELISIK